MQVFYQVSVGCSGAPTLQIRRLAASVDRNPAPSRCPIVVAACALAQAVVTTAVCAWIATFASTQEATTMFAQLVAAYIEVLHRCGDSLAWLAPAPLTYGPP
jgi:hypothetical protein